MRRPSRLASNESFGMKPFKPSILSNEVIKEEQEDLISTITAEERKRTTEENIEMIESPLNFVTTPSNSGTPAAAKRITPVA